MSLQNYGNATRVALLVDQALAKGVKPSEITVLTYYMGQKSVVAQKFEERAQVDGKTWEFKLGSALSSFESFQLKKNEFVFVDIVVIIQGKEQTAPTVEDNEFNEGAEFDERIKNPGRCSAHVKAVGVASLLWPSCKRSLAPSKINRPT